MLGDVEQPVPQPVAPGGVAGPVDGVGHVQPRQIQVLRRPQPVELHPGIHPGLALVGAVGVDLPGADQEPLARAKVVIMGDAAGVVGVEHPPAGDDVVEQVVVADKGPKGVEGGALPPAVLVGSQVKEAVVGENGEGIVVHRALTFSRRRKGPWNGSISQIFPGHNQKKGFNETNIRRFPQKSPLPIYFRQKLFSK